MSADTRPTRAEEEPREVENAMSEDAPVLGPTQRRWGTAWLDKSELLGDIRSIGDVPTRLRRRAPARPRPALHAPNANA